MYILKFKKGLQMKIIIKVIYCFFFLFFLQLWTLSTTRFNPNWFWFISEAHYNSKMTQWYVYFFFLNLHELPLTGDLACSNKHASQAIAQVTLSAWNWDQTSSNIKLKHVIHNRWVLPRFIWHIKNSWKRVLCSQGQEPSF